MPKPLERLNGSHVEAVLAAVTGSAGTRHRVLTALRAALNAAVKKHKETGLDWNRTSASNWSPRTPRDAAVDPGAGAAIHQARGR